MSKHHRGFTLIEVLIAAVILFTSIALTAEIYNSSAMFSNKAIKGTNYSQYASIAITSIKSDLRYEFQEGPLKESYRGRLTVGGIEFFWQAVKIKEIARYPNIATNDTPRARFGRYSVEAQAESQSNELNFEVFLWP